MSGRIGTAPCGHPGEAIIGHYYRCLQGCDSATRGEVSLGLKSCPSCGSRNVEPFEVEAAYYIFNPDATRIDQHCIDCGSCW